MTYQVSTRHHLIHILFVFLILLTQTACGGGGKSSRMTEYQHWQDHNLMVRDMLNVSTEAFYGEYGRLPRSLEELQDSKWSWFAPIAPDFAPDFELIDRPLESWDSDCDKVQFSFTETGFDCSYFIRKSEESGDPHQDSIGSSRAAASYEQHRSFDEDWARYDIRNSGYLRQNMIFSISRLLVRRFYERYHTMPGNADQLYRDDWRPSEEIFRNLPTIPEGRQYGVYVGLTTINGQGVLYFEFTRADNSKVTVRRAFKIESTENIVTIRETSLDEEEGVAREETKPFIDSAIPGWGIVDVG